MAFDFPSSPTVGQVYQGYTWDGEKWDGGGAATGPTGPTGTAGTAGSTGVTGPTGSQGTAGTAGGAGPTGPAGGAGPTGATGPAAGGSTFSGPIRPQGRLSLLTGTPVMTATQAAKTTIYYTPYNGDRVPIYDGTNMVITPFTELSVATTDTTKNPAAIGASKVNDWFVWNDAGTIRLSHGPDWTDDTNRGGSSITRRNGIFLNDQNITNGPAAFASATASRSAGTYVGTTRSNASSQLEWIFPGANTAGFFGVWNCYNRVVCGGMTYDTTASWSYNSTTVRQRRAQTSAAISFVCGVQEDIAVGTNAQFTTASSTSGFALIVGIGVDSTTVISGIAGQGSGGMSALSIASYPSAQLSTTSFGYHSWNALEATNGAEAVSSYGTLSGPPTRQGSGFSFQFPM